MDNNGNILFLYMAIVVFNLCVAGVLWAQNRNAHHRDLFFTWAGISVSFITQGATAELGHFWMTLGFAISVLGTLSAGSVMARTVGRDLPFVPLVGFWIFGVGFAAIGTAIGLPFWLMSLPVSVATGAPILYAAVDGLRTGWARLTPAGRLMYLSGTFLALHLLDFPFLRLKPEFGALGFTLALLALSMLAITAPAVLLEKSTAERVQVEEHNRMQSSFFANVSHELRTPLTLILSPLEALLHDPSFNLPPTVREYLASMQRSTARLLRLINNLLDLAKVDAGKVFLRYEPTDLGEFARSIVPAFEPLANARQITLDFQFEPTEAVHVDPERMDIVLQNLMANALKFTAGGGRVSVRVLDRPDEVWLEVEDTGIGIAQKDLGVIFDRFGQADGSITRRFGGTGIGLALVKDLVELHGGTVLVDSVLGTGSTFRVKLPKGTAHIREELRDRRAVDVPVFDERREGARDPVSGLGKDLGGEVPSEDRPVTSLASESGPRILIVDDNPDLRAFLQSILQATYRITLAVDGQEGLEIARAILPDLVLSDVMMPRLSGYDLTAALKGDLKTRGIPVILLTAKRGVDPALEGFEHGADDYIGKPFSTRELKARIKVQLDLRELARQLAELQKTAMLSTLAAGLAHEIRNPINALVNGLPALRNFLPPGDKRSDGLLRVLDDAAKRIDRMIVDLLDFSNLDRAEFRDWSPSEGVHSTIALLRHQVGSGVEVVTDLGFEGTVEGRAGPLNQVLLNLLDNALKAVGDRGEVRVTSKESNSGLELTVADDGPGIPPHVLPRIFDPFFTTRDVGVGTGLGLHLCKQIVHAHGGQLDVSSTPGQGATFRVWIPRTLGLDLRSA